MAKQAIKKKEFGIKKSISSLKADMGMSTKENLNIETSNADKKMEWLLLPKAFEDALKLPGIPLGYITTICGHSNTGKSTLVNCAIASAQRQGLIPVIYDTENNFDFQYAINCGMQAEPVYGDVEIEHIDEETGEVTYTTENRIINYDGDFFYFNNRLLAERYGLNDYSTGKETKQKRKQAVIEDVAASIKEFLDKQDEGEIDRGLVFIWDSVGSISSYKSYKSAVGNNQFDAGALTVSFNNIANSRIPGSRKVSSPYTNTMILINKVWLDAMTVQVGPPSLKLKGGNSFWYSTRLLILLGGQLSSSIKRLSATSKGVQYNYGIETKIKTIKNQLPTPWTISAEGTMCCVADGLVSPNDLDEWKKESMPSILEKLKDMSEKQMITEEDIVFTEEDNIE